MTHVLQISRALIPSVRLCGYEQFGHMQKAGKLEFRYASIRELTPELAGWADVVEFVRSDSAAELVCAKELRKAGKYLIYMLDDDLLEIPDGFQSSDYYHRKSVQANVRAIMHECHCFLSPSAHLREKYGKGFERVGAIEEPALFDTVPEKRADNTVRIGFAGSVDRAGDIDQILSETVERLLAHYGDRISVEFFGAKPAFADRLGLRHIPYCDSYAEYQATMQTLGWDIGLAPMPDTEFHRGKHYNKFIEYAACGIVGVYSDLLPYRRAVEHEISGMLCANDSEKFYTAISHLIEDDTLLARMRENVVQLANTRFSLPAVTDALERELDGILTVKTDRKPLEFTKKLRRIDLYDRLKGGIQQDGFFTFCLKKVKKFVFRMK